MDSSLTKTPLSPHSFIKTLQINDDSETDSRSTDIDEVGRSVATVNSESEVYLKQLPVDVENSSTDEFGDGNDGEVFNGDVGFEVESHTTLNMEFADVRNLEGRSINCFSYDRPHDLAIEDSVDIEPGSLFDSTESSSDCSANTFGKQMALAPIEHLRSNKMSLTYDQQVRADTEAKRSREVRLDMPEG